MELQKRILENVCTYVKPDGRLVYSTCTISEAENEAQIVGFLERHPEFQKVKECQILPSAKTLMGQEAMPETELKHFGESFIVTSTQSDGFYICVMGRRHGYREHG